MRSFTLFANACLCVKLKEITSRRHVHKRKQTGDNWPPSKVWEEITFEAILFSFEIIYLSDYSLEKDKEWLMREGLDIEIKKSHGRMSRVLRRVSCGMNHNENQDSLMSYFSVRKAPDGHSSLHVMTINR